MIEAAPPISAGFAVEGRGVEPHSDWNPTSSSFLKMGLTGYITTNQFDDVS